MVRLHARLCILLCTLPILALASCANSPKVETTHLAGVDFSQYQTYRWITEDLVLIQAGSGDPSGPSSPGPQLIRTVENEQRIRAAVDRELAARGLREAAGANADLIVAFTLGTKVRHQLQGGGPTPLDLVADDPATVTQGILNLYLLDPVNRIQVWSASTKKNLEPGDDPVGVINAAVAALLADYPPRAT